MKKRNYMHAALALTLAASLALTGCNDIDNPVTPEPEPGPPEVEMIRLKATIDVDTSTRMSYEDDPIGGFFNPGWGTGDAFKLIPATGGTTAIQNIDVSSIDLDDGSAEFTGPSPGASVSYVAFYPAGKAGDHYGTFNLALTGQKVDNADGDFTYLSNFHYMDAVISDLSQPIIFEHLISILKLSFKFPVDVTDIPVKITLSSSNNDLRISYNPGTTIYTSSDNLEIEVEGFEAAVDGFTAYVVIFPGEITGPLQVEVEGGSGVYSADIFGDGITIDKGKIYAEEIELIAVSANSVYDSTIASGSGDIPSGEGTENNPYLIKNAANLQHLVKSTSFYKGKYVKLDTDIEVTNDLWTPIDNFDGYFDGGEHTITGELNISKSNTGFFGKIANPENAVTIKNLSIKADITNTHDATSFGAIVAIINSPKDKIEIDNCHFSGNLNADSENSGGIVGQVVGTSADKGVTISNCTVSGSINSTNNINIGGVVGTLSGYSEVTSCTNNADITGTLQTGGIVGRCYSNVTGCKNHGEVTGSVNVGGIVGKLESAVTISYNENDGSVSGASEIGGIVGLGKANSKIENNTNDTDNLSGSRAVGGIVGKSMGSNLSGGNTNNSTTFSDVGED